MLIIDRFEGDIAVLENDDGNMQNVSRALLPENACEGDILVYSEGVYIPDDRTTEQRRREILELQESLWE